MGVRPRSKDGGESPESFRHIWNQMGEKNAAVALLLINQARSSPTIRTHKGRQHVGVDRSGTVLLGQVRLGRGPAPARAGLPVSQRGCGGQA